MRRVWAWGLETWQRFWAWHQFRYLVVAGCATVFYLAVVFVTNEVFGWHWLPSILTAHVVTISAFFWAYRGIVFVSTGRIWADFVKFISVWGTGAIFGLVGAAFFVELFSVTAVVSQILTQVIVAVLSYLAHRFFTFNRREESLNRRPPADTGNDPA